MKFEIINLPDEIVVGSKPQNIEYKVTPGLLGLITTDSIHIIEETYQISTELYYKFRFNKLNDPFIINVPMTMKNITDDTLTLIIRSFNGPNILRMGALGVVGIDARYQKEGDIYYRTLVKDHTLKSPWKL